MSAKLNLKIIQGSTFREVLRLESSTKSYITITGITKSAPVVITAPSHNLVEGWRIRVTDVVGMKEINCNTDEYYIVTDINNDDLTINAVNSLSYTAYTSGGVVEYNVPTSLAGMTAIMQIRPKLTSSTILKSLTTENGGITINDTDHTITIEISSTDTDDFNFNSAVYSLELINGTDTTQLITGTITLDKEVTRPAV